MQQCKDDRMATLKPNLLPKKPPPNQQQISSAIKFQKHKIEQDKIPLAKVVLKRTFSNCCFSLKVSASCTLICWMHCLLSPNLSLPILRMPGGQESTFAVVRFHCLFYSLDLHFFSSNLYIFSFSQFSTLAFLQIFNYSPW